MAKRSASTETTIAVSEFKAKCLGLLEELAATGETLIVTKRGKPIARVERIRTAVETLEGAWAGACVADDIVEADWSEEFEATR